MKTCLFLSYQQGQDGTMKGRNEGHGEINCGLKDVLLTLNSESTGIMRKNNRQLLIVGQFSAGNQGDQS